jgi:hypothetical protein
MTTLCHQSIAPRVLSPTPRPGKPFTTRTLAAYRSPRPPSRLGWRPFPHPTTALLTRTAPLPPRKSHQSHDSQRHLTRWRDSRTRDQPVPVRTGPGPLHRSPLMQYLPRTQLHQRASEAARTTSGRQRGSTFPGRNYTGKAPVQRSGDCPGSANRIREPEHRNRRRRPRNQICNVRGDEDAPLAGRVRVKDGNGTGGADTGTTGGPGQVRGCGPGSGPNWGDGR